MCINERQNRIRRPIKQTTVFSERTSVGLDVHARSVVAHAMDTATGEIFRARLCPDHGEVTRWINDLPGPVAVIYEAGPTGYGLARVLQAQRIRTVVAAPSKLQGPAGDRVKTDAHDGEHLSTLLRLDAFSAVTIPDQTTEAARDLVRAREDCRADLMRARHGLSKLLLRYGFVYSGGQAWTGVHDAWLRRQRFDSPLTRAAFDEAYDTLAQISARRERLDHRIEMLAADSPYTGVVRRLGCLGGISTLTGFGRSRSATGPGSAGTRSAPMSGWSLLRRRRVPAARRARSPRPVTPTFAGSWSRPLGTTAPDTCQARRSGTAGTWPRPPLEPEVMPGTVACITAGNSSRSATNDPPSRTSRSPVNSPAGAGHSPSNRSSRPGLHDRGPGWPLAGATHYTERPAKQL